MASREAKMFRELEELGFVYDRKNSKGLAFYIHEDTGVEIKIPSGRPTDNQCTGILTDARRRVGVPTKDNKRNAGQIKAFQMAEREAAGRELEKARLDRERLAASKHTEAEIRRAEEIVMRADQKFRYWDQLMRSSAA